MNIYEWAIVFLTLYAIVCYFVPKKELSRKLFVFLSSSHLFIIQGLRSVSVGADSSAYNDHYNFASRFYTSGSNISNILLDRFEPGYVILEISSLKLGFSFQMLILLISLFHFLVLSYLFFKYSKNLYISYILYMVLRVYDFGFSGLRQIIAMTIVLVSFKYLNENKNRKFLTLIILATLFHKTAIFFIVLYFILNTRFKKIYRTLYPLIFLVFIVFYKQLSFFLATLFNEGYVSVNDSINFNFHDLIILGIFFLGLWLKKMLQNNNGSFMVSMTNNEMRLSDNLLLITSFSSLLQILSLNSYYFFRINLYTFPLVALFASHLLNYYAAYFGKSSGLKRISFKYLIVIVFFIFAFSLYVVIMRSNPHMILPHYFFWEN